MPTKKAPNFKLPNEKNEIIELKQFLGKNIVLYFYPRDDTPGCTIEAKDFTCLAKDFEKLNTIVIGISKDKPNSHQKFIDKHELNLILLADEDHKVQEKYEVWKPKKFMGREFMGTVRSTFLIDEKGIIVKAWENVKAKGHAEAVLEFLRERNS